MSADPERLAPAIEQLHALARQAGRPKPEVACLGALAAEPERATAQLRNLAARGVTRFLTGARYDSDTTPFRRAVDSLLAGRRAFGA
jgi:hypothetical protein